MCLVFYKDKIGAEYVGSCPHLSTNAATNKVVINLKRLVKVGVKEAADGLCCGITGELLF